MQLVAFAWPKRRHSFARHRRAAVAVLFATMVIPILGLIGLSIDYGIWNEADSSLSLAASSAALNAAKTAASALALADANYVAEGVTSGKQWFLAELGQGSYQADSGTVAPTVTITTASNMVTATVSYTSTVNSVFGKLFHMARYNITVTTAATMSAGSYLEVVLMLDNSSSMGIGAGELTDMKTMMQLSPCDASNEFYRTAGNANYVQATSPYEAYSLYQYSNQPYPYTGQITPPIASGSLTFKPTTGATVLNYCSAAGSGCQQAEQCPNVNGYPAYAGPPCAFACHSDGTKAAGLGNDLWAMARRNGVTLRLDAVKNATNTVLNAMKNNNISSLNNLSVGVYTFNATLNPIYPGAACTPKAFGCEAGSNWTTAISAVGLPPQTAGVYVDTGIQPPVAAVGGDNDNTAVEEAMTNLATNYVTAAGNGATATTPRKVLMLITDGFEDDPIASAGINGLRKAMPASACTPFKNMGYTVYVIYTPYYALMHTWYLASGQPIAEGSGASSIIPNLQACASNANDYIAATDATDLSAALLAFLTDALNSPATFTQ